ncbi:MAG: radical SAM protein [Deltaproteobacteria bacterium]|nr:radical SAM protein [Deltaproteobacteria bacterium]
MRYSDLYQSGELRERVRTAYARLRCCDLCPHQCRVDRISGETGFCRAGLKPKIASASLHRGEEPPISGTRGSGTIFFSWCTLRCRFCQNFPISQLGNGEQLSTRGLSDKMLKLQKLGAHNINLVTPGHYLPQILAALWLSVPRGFRLPLVWNSNGYETLPALALLEGIVDIYLPDMKYSDEEPAVRFSSAPGYRDINRAAVREMFRQVGQLSLDDEGIARRGLIIRHLVLPEGAAGSRETLRWIAENLGAETHLALMNQYFPAYEAENTPGLQRKITAGEYAEAVTALDEYGLENGWVQE